MRGIGNVPRDKDLCFRGGGEVVSCDDLCGEMGDVGGEGGRDPEWDCDLLGEDGGEVGGSDNTSNAASKVAGPAFGLRGLEIPSLRSCRGSNMVL